MSDRIRKERPPVSPNEPDYWRRNNSHIKNLASGLLGSRSFAIFTPVAERARKSIDPEIVTITKSENKGIDYPWIKFPPEWTDTFPAYIIGLSTAPEALTDANAMGLDGQMYPLGVNDEISKKHARYGNHFLINSLDDGLQTFYAVQGEDVYVRDDTKMRLSLRQLPKTKSPLIEPQADITEEAQRKLIRILSRIASNPEDYQLETV